MINEIKVARKSKIKNNYKMLTIVISLLVGMIVGLVIGIFSSRNKNYIQVKVYEKEIEKLKQQLSDEKTEAQQTLQNVKNEGNELLAEVRKECANRAQETLKYAIEEKEKACSERIQEQEKRHKEAISAQQIRFEEMMNKVVAQLKSETDELLKQRQKEFTESSKTSLGDIVNPLKEDIDKMKKVMHDSDIKQTELHSALKTQMENAIKYSDLAKQSAEELARVFKHGSKVQGDWGETILNEILESQGLIEGVHYEIQGTLRDSMGNVVKTEEGNILRPDVILHLDKQRDVIIDSKVSLKAFMDYVNADDEEKRKQCLKSHIDSLQRHVKELSLKDYSSYIQEPKIKMDYVIMFVPHTGALWTALNAQPDLWRAAMEKNVFIADEQTLFAAIRIIKLTWTQIVQAQNHEKVYALANEIIDRVGQFIKRYQAVGQALDKAKTAYEEGNKKLQPTGQSILQSCNKLIKLGGKQSDKNPLPAFKEVEDLQEIEASNEQAEEM